MNYQDLLALEPTCSPNVSLGIFRGIFYEQPTWRCYSSAKHPDVEYWINRYLNAHCTVPGLISKETFAGTMPLEIFHVAIAEEAVGMVTIHGALFANGAAMQFARADTQLAVLLVEDKVAELWKYPEDYVRAGRPLDALRGSEDFEDFDAVSPEEEQLASFRYRDDTPPKPSKLDGGP